MSEDVPAWLDLAASVEPIGRSDLPDEANLPALILFTSGSTSQPTGVVHTHRSVLATARVRERTQRLCADEVTLVATHICHSAGSMGLSFPTLLTGGTVVLLASFDPAAWLDAVRTYRPTRGGLLPTQILDVIEHESASSTDFGVFKEVMVGGGAVTRGLYAKFREETGTDLREGYGLTECEGRCLSRYYEPARPGSAGKPGVGVEMRLVDDEEAEVEVGAIGEIRIRSDSVMSGYWGDLENTEKVLADGWLKTGDLGRWDEDGYLYFSCRIKELIIKGGSNVAPGEVEQVLDDHPGVELSGVVGTPDAHYGELIHAFVERRARSETPVTETQLRQYAAARLAAYKVPDRWTFLDALPRNDVGKIDRKDLHTLATRLDAPEHSG